MVQTDTHRIHISLCQTSYEILAERAEKKGLSVPKVIEIILYDALKLKENILEN